MTDKFDPGTCRIQVQHTSVRSPI